MFNFNSHKQTSSKDCFNKGVISHGCIFLKKHVLLTQLSILGGSGAAALVSRLQCVFLILCVSLGMRITCMLLTTWESQWDCFKLVVKLGIYL